MNYLIIIISGIIALIGATMKTSDDKGVKHFLNLKSAGKWVVLLSAALIVSSIISEYRTNEEKEDARLAAQNKATQDSLRYIHDSLTLEKRSIYDSIGHSKTLSDLQKQREFDSLQLLRDSVHFLTTVNKFGIQLNKQESALFELNKILNPLFPLEISCYYEVDLNSFSETSTYLDSLVNTISNIQNPQLPEEFILTRNNNNPYDSINGVWYVGSSKIEDQKYDSTFIHLHGLVNNFSPSTFNITFYDKKKETTSPYSEEFKFSGLSEMNVNYSYTTLSKALHITIDGIVNQNNIHVNRVSSVEDLNLDTLVIYLESIPGFDSRLHSITFRTGITFQNSYILYFLKPDRDNYGNKAYYAEFDINNIRKGRYKFSRRASNQKHLNE